MRGRRPGLIRGPVGLTVALVIAFACVHGVMSASENGADAKGPLTVEAEKVDFGDIAPDEAHEKTVQITNSSEANVTISKVESSCYCTESELEDSVLAPGDSTSLKISLALDEYPVDDVHTRVSLYATDDTKPAKEIEVAAKITPEYVIEPTELDFGRVKCGQTGDLSFWVVQNGEQRVKVESVGVPEGIEGKIESAGGATANRQKVVLRLAPRSSPGPWSGVLKLRTNITRIAAREFPVRARFVGIECKVTPRVVVFGPSKPGTEIGIIQIESAEPITLGDVSSSHEDVEVRPDTAESGTRHTVHVRLRDAAQSGDRLGKVKVTLEDGAYSEVREIPLYGTVSP